MTIAIVLSSLALLAATVNIFLTLREKKRSEKRKTASLQYTDAAVQEARAELGCYIDRHLEKLDKRIKELESGTVPDYEKAKEAAKAVNDFNAGISGILGFDPMDALRKQRESAGEP